MATIEVKGLRELGEALKGFGEVLGKKYLGEATLAAAVVIKNDAVSRAPVATGAMRAAIDTFKRTNADPSTAEYAVGVRKIKLTAKIRKVLRGLKNATGSRVPIEGDAFYWRFVEFGTSKMAPKPFLRPAFESQKTNAIDEFKKSLANGVEQASREVAR